MQKLYTILMLVTSSAYGQFNGHLESANASIFQANKVAFQSTKSIYGIDYNDTLGVYFIVKNNQDIQPGVLLKGSNNIDINTSSQFDYTGLNKYFTQSPAIDKIKSPSSFSSELTSFRNPDISSYVTLPNEKHPVLEFFDHEISSDNVSFSLQSFVVGENYDSKISASPLNGASLYQRALYQDCKYGNGDTAWYIAAAPTVTSPASITLITGANFSQNNSAGSFIIKSPNNNTFELSTTNLNSGFVGFSDPVNTSLKLSSDKIYGTGEFISAGLLTSLNGVKVYESIYNNDNINISSSAIIWSNGDDSKSYVGTSYAGTFLQEPSSQFLIQTSLSGGLAFRTWSNVKGLSSGIQFSVNGINKQYISSSTIVFGELPERFNPHILVDFNSQSSVLKLPVIVNDFFKNVQTPVEGMIAYNQDMKTMVFYDGDDWFSLKKEKIVTNQKRKITNKKM